MSPTTIKLPAHTPRLIWVVLDKYMQPCAVYNTRRAADTNKGLFGTVVAYTPRAGRAR